MERSAYIQEYAVKIEYHSIGSGVIVKGNTNYHYLITAKHNFKKKDRDNNINVDTLQLSRINVLKDNQKVCIIDSVIFHQEDLIIFLVEPLGTYLRDLGYLSILKDTPTDKMDYFLYGFPALQPSGHFIDKIDSRFTTNSENIFSIKDTSQHLTKYLKGLSGSGVFIQDGAVCYLVGILLQSDDRYNILNIFDLSKVIDNLNTRLAEYSYPHIEEKKDIVDGEMTTTNQMYRMILNRNPNNFLIKKAKNTFDDKKLDELILNPEVLNNFVENMRTHNLEKLEQEYHRELADMYLLSAFISNKSKSLTKAKKYLKKAIKYNENYTRYYKIFEECNPNSKEFKNKDNLIRIKKEQGLLKSFFNFIFFISLIILIFQLF